MRNLHYRNKGFRLSEEVIIKLEERKGDLSYNQLFKQLLKEEENVNTVYRWGLLGKLSKRPKK